MRLNSLLVSLLVLSTLLYEAQGIRLGKVSLSSAPNHEIQGKGSLVTGISVKGGTAGKAIICKDENNCSGMNRKLMAKTTSSTSTSTSTTTTTKSQMNDGKKDHPTSEAKSNSTEGGLTGKEENLSVNPRPVTKHREVTPERYPDIIDIAGMDYSPARRKPPIHN